MELLNRLVTSLFVLTALLLALTSFATDGLVELYAPLDPYGNRMSWLDMHQKSEQLSREVDSTYRRLCIKNEVIEALTRGDIPLIEAAAEFRSLHLEPLSWHHPNRPRPELDDGARWCREVIEWCDGKMRAERSVAEAVYVRQRLEAELQEHLNYYGTVMLPD